MSISAFIFLPPVHNAALIISWQSRYHLDPSAFCELVSPLFDNISLARIPQDVHTIVAKHTNSFCLFLGTNAWLTCGSSPMPHPVVSDSDGPRFSDQAGIAGIRPRARVERSDIIVSPAGVILSPRTLHMGVDSSINVSQSVGMKFLIFNIIFTAILFLYR